MHLGRATEEGDGTVNAQQVHQATARNLTRDVTLYAEATDLVETVAAASVACVRRSTVVRRLSEGSLPFAGRIAWLEQQWEGLRLLREREQRLQALREDIQPAHEQLDRGEGEPFDAEGVKARGRKRLAAKGDQD